MDSEHQPHRRGVVSYVNRGGRMTPGQQRAWQRQWPEMGRAVPELAPGPVDFDAWFRRSAPLTLEIGPGMGETTTELAHAEPDVNYVAIEVYEAGLGQLMLRAENLGLTNLRLLHGDTTTFLTHHVEPETFSTVRIFYPDPWPKKRHHKRRLLQPSFVSLLSSRIRPGGHLHVATDWQDYAEQILAVCSDEPTLVNRFDDWAPRPDWRPVTKFEQRARREGRTSRDLLFDKVDTHHGTPA